jgi:peptidoglycan lytic transglycosylase
MGGGVKGSWIWVAACLAGTLLYGAPAGAQSAKTFSGRAAYYSKDYQGVTSSGARYDPTKFTCAHRTLPFGTRLRVSDPRSHRSVVVTVNDRGPFDKGRVIDLSFAAATALHMQGRGVIRVTATIESAGAEAAAAAR